MSSISSRTNSPATVLADLPWRAFLRARSRVRFSGIGFPSVKFPELPFRAVESLALRAREALSGAIDVEVEHRHRRAERRALAALAALGRALERSRYRARAALREDAALEIERVARAHDARRPALRSLCHERRAAIAVPDFLNRSSGALLGPQSGADRSDQLLGVDRFVDAVDEAGGHQALALDLREGGERDRRGIALVAAGELDRARAAQRLEAVLARHREVDEQHVRPARRQRRFERGAERAPGIEAFDLRAGLSQRERHDFVG